MKKVWIIALFLTACSQREQPGPENPAADNQKETEVSYVNNSSCEKISLSQNLLGNYGITELNYRLAQSFKENEKMDLENWMNCLDQKYNINCKNKICQIGEKTK